MKIEKAIERNQNIYNLMKEKYEAEDRAAIKLGIEALKAELKVRRQNPQLIYPSLPGETEE